MSKTRWYAEQAALFGEAAKGRHYDFSIVANQDREIRADVARLARAAGHFGRLALGESCEQCVAEREAEEYHREVCEALMEPYVSPSDRRYSERKLREIEWSGSFQ